MSSTATHPFASEASTPTERPSAPPRQHWLYSAEDERLFNELRTGAPLAGPVVRLRPLMLGGRWIGVRPGTTDVLAFERAFSGGWGNSRQSAPMELPVKPGRPLMILDCGCNVGYSTAALLYTYPQAQVIGVDLDPRNIEQARRELAPFGPRCRLIGTGIWGSSGKVELAGLDGWTRAIAGLNAYPGCPCRPKGAHGANVGDAITVPDLLDSLHIDRLDYLHMDVAGSEAAVFDMPREWVKRVSCIKVHVSAPADVKRVAWRLSEQGLIVVSTIRTPSTETSSESIAVSAVCREWWEQIPRFPQVSMRPDPAPGPW
jgi:FkbM family methyltransferase